MEERLKHLIARLEAHLGRPLTAEEKRLLDLGSTGENSPDEQPPKAKKAGKSA